MTLLEQITLFELRSSTMLEAPTHHQKQIWVAQRLYRICSALHDESVTEPCLEQYENRVQLIMADQLTPATTAWIEIIVQSLRMGSPFDPAEYVA